MSYLVLVRHGLSDYNKKGMWTGWDNPPLAPEGIDQATTTGNELKDIQFDMAFVPDQIRSLQTIEHIKKTVNQTFPITESSAIRERNYGDYTKKNKWEVKEQIGEEEFQKLRRAWDYPVPNGESLKQVYDRVIPYFETSILPLLQQGKNVIIGSSGNALRSLVKFLEHISDDEIAKLEIGTGEAYVYKLDSNGTILNKEVRGKNPLAGKV